MCDPRFHLLPWAGGVMTSPHLAWLHPSGDRLVPPCPDWSLGEQLVPLTSLGHPRSCWEAAWSPAIETHSQDSKVSGSCVMRNWAVGIQGSATFPTALYKLPLTECIWVHRLRNFSLSF
ncbi:unnamed protein product [Rangifer tarandus platyrhynchus]|uniref:Uncharacterized protein n=2 Tax=Rangifer tarandus platyrhynchus TaxID=3082113 RepID=A0AC59ZFM9_RANTA|nr:unnamed protein product [Rangifer tarandus platyrhynchus]